MLRTEIDRLMSPYGLLSAEKIEVAGKDFKQVEDWCLRNADLGDAQSVLTLNRMHFKKPVPSLVGKVQRLPDPNWYMGWVKLDQENGNYAFFNGEGQTESIGAKCTDAVLSILGDKSPQEMRWMTVHRFPTNNVENSNKVVENWVFSLDQLTWNSKVVELVSRPDQYREDLAMKAILDGVKAYMVVRSLV